MTGMYALDLVACHTYHNFLYEVRFNVYRRWRAGFASHKTATW